MQAQKNSNTTLVKVKCKNYVEIGRFFLIQIQHLLKLNEKLNTF